jgi:hypothetical protein
MSYANGQGATSEGTTNNQSGGWVHPDQQIPLDQMLLVTDAPWDPNTLPPRPWIAPPYIMRGQITLPHGPGAVGKSQLVAAWTCSLALGVPFGRLHPEGRCKVLLVNLEDDETEVKRLLSAALKYFRASPHELKGYVYRVSVNVDKYVDETMFEVNLRGNGVETTRTFEASKTRV